MRTPWNYRPDLVDEYLNPCVVDADGEVSAGRNAEPSAAFTPGPWWRSGSRQKVGGADAHSVCASIGGKDIVIASVWYDPKTHEGFHDAGLMAAAPDLLEAAKTALLAFHYAGDDATGLAAVAERLLRAAIAKAEGKP